MISKRPARKNALIVLAVLAGFCCLSNRCDKEETEYLLEQAPGQFELLLKRVPFERVLSNPDLDPEVRKTLEFVLDVKEYGVEELGLLDNENYEVYVELERQAVCWNLTACPELSVEPVRWDFPVAGEVPYLGFFKKEDALDKKAELESKGYDVYVRPVGAYSMLGIVSDPFYSSLLDARKADLANLVLHEMLHSTVFIKGKMEFNENLALFVGNRGSLEYLSERFGPDSAEVRYSAGSNHDAEIFSREVMKLYHELESVYTSDLSKAEKLERKKEVFSSHKRHFRDEVLPAMKTDRYKSWPEKDLDNAVVVSRVVYYHDLSLYEDLYRKMDSDLKAVIDFFKEVQEKKGVEPEEYARQWLED
ncbi:MAG: aminopeptidase [bacterium]